MISLLLFLRPRSRATGRRCCSQSRVGDRGRPGLRPPLWFALALLVPVAGAATLMGSEPPPPTDSKPAGQARLAAEGAGLPAHAPDHRPVPSAPASTSAATADATTTAPLQDRSAALLAGELQQVGAVPVYSARLLAEFYAERDHRPAWDRVRAESLLALAHASRADGFEASDFHAEAIAALLARGTLDEAEPNGRPDSARADADLLLSDALLRYLHHFQYGKYNPRHVGAGWTFVPRADAEVIKSDLAAVLAAPDLAAAVTARLPQPPFYVNLKRAYQRYLALADQGDFKPIPAGPNLGPGARDSRLVPIRARLAVSEGYETPPGNDSEYYDDGLAEVVKAFQRRSGLAADAVIGPQTLRALNRPLEDRLPLLRANLERMRWLYRDLPPDYLFVDITGFRLQLYRDHQPVWETRTVVGTAENQTPMFRDEMDHLVFNPTWTVPPTIQRKMGRASGRYRVVDRRTGHEVSGVDASDPRRYRIVQPAGPGNALGQVKFMFPNDHAIYLHDTPSRHLFSHGTRSYSYGCVRVQNPLELAAQVLEPFDWDSSGIQAVVRRGQTRYVNLDEPLTILLFYLTAVADDAGRVGFRRDIYGRDPALLAVLDRPAHPGDPRLVFREPQPEPEPSLESDPAASAAADLAAAPVR